THNLSVLMPGLVPGTHVFRATKQGVGGRDKPGHDALGDCGVCAASPLYLKYLSIGNRARPSAGTSSRVENGRRIGRVASMIILAVMMSSVCEGSSVLPLEFLMMSTSSLAWVRVATAYMTSCSLYGSMSPSTTTTFLTKSTSPSAMKAACLLSPSTRLSI